MACSSRWTTVPRTQSHRYARNELVPSVCNCVLYMHILQRRRPIIRHWLAVDRYVFIHALPFDVDRNRANLGFVLCVQRRVACKYG